MSGLFTPNQKVLSIVMRGKGNVTRVATVLKAECSVLNSHLTKISMSISIMKISIVITHYNPADSMFSAGIRSQTLI